MKGKGPMMIIAIGLGKKSEGEEMRDDDEMEDMMGGGMTYAKGGMTSKGRDGCAIRGKTKGKAIVMRMGGKR